MILIIVRRGKGGICDELWWMINAVKSAKLCPSAAAAPYKECDG